MATVFRWARCDIAALIGRDNEDESWGVPDLTSDDAEFCDAMDVEDTHAICTRRVGHGRRHAAGNGAVIVAVWP